MSSKLMDIQISPPLPEPCEANLFLCDYINILCTSLAKYGHNLVPLNTDKTETAYMIWHASYVVLAHNADTTPRFTYANQCGLQLLAMNWQQLTHCHSYQSAEQAERSERSRLLQAARDKGIITNYTGIRITSRGRRFRIRNATVWNLEDHQHRYIGQAATFKDWEFIDDAIPDSVV